MAPIQPDSELMEHNYFHSSYLTTEREVGLEGCVCLKCIHCIFVRHEMQEKSRQEGVERRWVAEGWESELIIIHVWQEIKVTYFRIN